MFEYLKELGLPKQVAAILGIAAIVFGIAYKWADKEHIDIEEVTSEKVLLLEQRQNSYELKALQRQKREIQQEIRAVARAPLPEPEKAKDIDNLKADLDEVADDISYFREQRAAY